MRFITCQLITVLLSFSITAFSQADQSAVKKLVDQYNDLKANTETYNEFKVIREARLDQWFAVVQDSIKTLKTKIVEERSAISKLQDTLSSFDSEKQKLLSSLSEFEYGQTHISVLGIDFSKSGFIVITFIVEIGLLFTLGFLSFRYLDNQRVTSETIKEHNRLQKEFEEYKKRALDKQTRLARDLQTERNRLEEQRRKR